MFWVKFALVVFTFVYFVGEKVEKEVAIDKARSDYLQPLRNMGVQCPEVVVAQILLETDYLRSKIYKENHNLFGMKESSRTWDIGSQHKHAKYPDDRYSVLDYREWQIKRAKGRIFKDNEEYIYFLGHLWQNRDGSWARYAEDPNYEEKLRVLIKKIKK